MKKNNEKLKTIAVVGAQMNWAGYTYSIIMFLFYFNCTFKY